MTNTTLTLPVIEKDDFTNTYNFIAAHADEALALQVR